MKLVIRQYLASLRERGELDAILPDLLSQMGLTVLSRPRRGTRQDGVDVGAVGSLDGGEESVYLFSIKAGDLTRAAWDGNPQALRPSLNAVVGPYVRNRLPVEHRNKPIVVCVCVGGDIREEVRPDLVAYFETHATDSPRSVGLVALFPAAELAADFVRGVDWRQADERDREAPPPGRAAPRGCEVEPAQGACAA